MSTPQPSSQELNTLVEITKILTGRFPFLEQCQAALVALADFTGSDFVTFRQMDPEDSTLDVVATFDHSIHAENADFPLDIEADSLSARALEGRVPVVVSDYPVLETRHQGYVDLGVKSALVLPVKVDGEIFGTLGFASKSLDHYQEDDVRVLEAIGAVVGMMVAKAELQENDVVEANIGRIVSSPLVGPEIFEKFAEEAAKLIEFDRLALNSVNLRESTYIPITEFLFGDELPDHTVGVIQEFRLTGLEVVVLSRSSQRLDLGEHWGTEPKFRTSGPLIAAGQPHRLGVPLIVGD
jgi:hypothetical protein